MKHGIKNPVLDCKDIYSVGVRNRVKRCMWPWKVNNQRTEKKIRGCLLRLSTKFCFLWFPEQFLTVSAWARRRDFSQLCERCLQCKHVHLHIYMYEGVRDPNSNVQRGFNKCSIPRSLRGFKTIDLGCSTGRTLVLTSYVSTGYSLYMSSTIECQLRLLQPLKV